MQQGLDPLPQNQLAHRRFSIDWLLATAILRCVDLGLRFSLSRNPSSSVGQLTIGMLSDNFVDLAGEAL